MRLTSFRVQGFKNLLAPIAMEDLGPINLLHGENNVGKSNLLRAIEVFFRLLATVNSGSSVPIEQTLQVTDAELRNLAIRGADLFNYAVPHPVEMTAALALDDAEIALAGIQPPFDCTRVSLALSLESRGGGSVGLLWRSFRFGDQTEIMVKDRKPELEQFARRFSRFLLERFLGPRGIPHVGVDRRPDAAVDALYDASASQDRRQAMQWDRFGEVMGAFRDILGEGRFIAVLPRGERQARLFYETATMRVPLHALGSGVQSIVALFGHILTSGAAIVAVEEPELNLRWALQERVRDALRDLVGKEGAPSQLFITSHSGAFETRETFYLMRQGQGGPVVEQRPVSDIPLIVGGAAPAGPVTASRAPAYVSGEGTLRLPERIRDAVGVQRGGGVSFVDKGDGVVEMMSDDTLLRRAGIHDDA